MAICNHYFYAIAQLAFIQTRIRREFFRLESDAGNRASIQVRSKFLSANPWRTYEFKRVVRPASYRNAARLQNFQAWIQNSLLSRAQIGRGIHPRQHRVTEP